MDALTAVYLVGYHHGLDGLYTLPGTPQWKYYHSLCGVYQWVFLEAWEHGFLERVGIANEYLAHMERSIS